MFRTLITRRTFVSTARIFKEKSFTEQAAETAKGAAGAFKADGAVGKHFNPEGKAGATADEVGGPFSKDGAVGKQFKKEGAIGGLGQKVAETGEKKAEEKK